MRHLRQPLTDGLPPATPTRTATARIRPTLSRAQPDLDDTPASSGSGSASSDNGSSDEPDVEFAAPYAPIGSTAHRQRERQRQWAAAHSPDSMAPAALVGVARWYTNEGRGVGIPSGSEAKRVRRFHKRLNKRLTRQRERELARERKAELEGGEEEHARARVRADNVITAAGDANTSPVLAGTGPATDSNAAGGPNGTSPFRTCLSELKQSNRTLGESLEAMYTELMGELKEMRDAHARCSSSNSQVDGPRKDAQAQVALAEPTVPAGRLLFEHQLEPPSPQSPQLRPILTQPEQPEQPEQPGQQQQQQQAVEGARRQSLPPLRGGNDYGHGAPGRPESPQHAGGSPMRPGSPVSELPHTPMRRSSSTEELRRTLFAEGVSGEGIAGPPAEQVHHARTLGGGRLRDHMVRPKAGVVAYMEDPGSFHSAPRSSPRARKRPSSAPRYTGAHVGSRSPVSRVSHKFCDPPLEEDVSGLLRVQEVRRSAAVAARAGLAKLVNEVRDEAGLVLAQGAYAHPRESPTGVDSIERARGRGRERGSAKKKVSLRPGGGARPLAGTRIQSELVGALGRGSDIVRPQSRKDASVLKQMQVLAEVEERVQRLAPHSKDSMRMSYEDTVTPPRRRRRRRPRTSVHAPTLRQPDWRY